MLQIQIIRELLFFIIIIEQRFFTFQLISNI